MPSVHSLNVSLGGVPKLPVSQVKVSLNGLEGDSHNDLKHHGGLSRAVCLYSLELIDDLKLEGHNIYPGSTGENITIKGLDWNVLESGLKLKIGGVVIILTNPATPCNTISSSFNLGNFSRISVKKHPLWSRWYASVVQEGFMEVGDNVSLLL
ncbi:MAG: sulfurase [Euryarchaeota archaeon]|nr:sulfurase [Euryarchaeota archaeon]|tara:strand:+ start:1092 stop:1550 length:459 start_codon:yes stop_codon:yes gene_type:complete